MSRALSSYDYGAYLTDPDRLEVPIHFDARPLPALIEPDSMPCTPVPASRDKQQLVILENRDIRVLSPYWHEGWSAAQPRTYVREGVACLLDAVVKSLPTGFKLAILDGWRSLDLQSEIYRAAYADPSLPPGFVSEPSASPHSPPPHLTGGSVDVTLTWKGHPLALGTPFDAFTDTARAAAFEDIPGRVQQLRRLLFWAMHDQGFRVIDCEWWHYEIGTRRWSAITGGEVWYGAADPQNATKA